MVEPKKLVLEAWVKSALPPVSVVAKRLVEVALVEVEVVMVAPPTTAVVMLPLVAVRLVAKRFVEVALVVVARVLERNCIVDEESEINPPVYVLSAVHVFGVVVPGKSPTTANRARASVKYKLVFSVRSSVVAPPTT